MVVPIDVKEDKTKGEQALRIAKRTNADKVIPIRVNRYTVIQITEAQRADKGFMKRFCKRWGIELEIINEG